LCQEIFYLIFIILIIFISNSHVNVSFDKNEEVYFELLGLHNKKYLNSKNDSIELIKKVVCVISNFGSLEPLPFGGIKILKSFFNYKKDF
jgi:hypothetical protein